MHTQMNSEPSIGGPSVAIIGAGFAGIAMAVRLIRSGISNFTIFEAGDGIGGTWFHNTYPGAEVDTPSHMYSYSFKPYDWSRPFATQGELLGYLEETADEWGLGDRLELRTRIVEIEWDERSQSQTVRSDDGREWRFTAVVSSIGLLNVPAEPNLPGRELYGGQVVHTARWNHSVPWEGKRVAVIGTGSSAAQVVPALAPGAASLTLFQRQPAWVDMKERSTFTPEQRRRLNSPRGYRRERTRLFFNQEKNWFGGRVVRPGSAADRKAIDRCTLHLANSVADPELRALLTPKGAYLAKRPVRSNEYLPAIQRENVRVVASAVAALYEDGVIDANGEKHPADVVVTATGFRPAEFLLGMTVVGEGGRDIHATWGDDPQAFLGISVPGFPNFFMMYGPNTNFYAIVFNLERQADYIARVLRRMVRKGYTSAAVKQTYHDVFNDLLQRRMAKTSFAQGQSYFRSKSGRVVTQWPEGAIVYAALTRFLALPATRFSRERTRGADEPLQVESLERG
ncbi:NAD(P)/FAD-dependent oxidoreductase [Microbacterium aoyamense]|uniref:NAD(P)/FAD-dependent oxidoreductase n=1 Tax=Microbacterium aoyamense TaxID=344166 RepID=A0ABN2Q176_9MICO|nr:NAD(P)/FAD-dependent oxidoreductase [Microbacterium aoyamense]